MDHALKNNLMIMRAISRKIVFLCALFSLLSVWLLWGFWTKGPYALGFNMTFLMLMLLGTMLYQQGVHVFTKKRHLFWLIPVFLVILQFGIYENPFFKMTALIALPFMTFVYFVESGAKEGQKIKWSFPFMVHLFTDRFFAFLHKAGEAWNHYLSTFLPKNKANNQVMRQVIVGLLIFFVLASFLFIPLLSSADSAFADLMRGALDWVLKWLSPEGFWKFICFGLLSIFSLATLIGWLQPFESKDGDQKPLSSISTGIVLGGVLMLYVLFLGLQVEKLMIGTLPIDFSEAVILVKSGFWELLFLTIINIGFYLIIFKRTSPLVQHLLTVFAFASLLLLFSAAQRMGLYVLNYGFSYEKFYAFYTVLYCVILFILLIGQDLMKKNADVIKMVIFLFIWMYGIVGILPVEKMIFETNVRLAERPMTRIELSEMQMLSMDAFGSYEKYTTFIDQASFNEPQLDRKIWMRNWQAWINNLGSDWQRKEWYEFTISSLKSSDVVHRFQEIYKGN